MHNIEQLEVYGVKMPNIEMQYFTVLESKQSSLCATLTDDGLLCQMNG